MEHTVIVYQKYMCCISVGMIIQFSWKRDSTRGGADEGMISLNHSCGLFGVDCGNTPSTISPLYTRMHTTLCYYWHKLILKVRLSSEAGHQARAGTAECSRHSRSRIELANRICMEQVVTIPSDSSQRRLALAAFAVPLVRATYFRRATFRVSPLGPAAGLRKVCHRQCI